jgi:BirA family transcriptional regulator, biotin operon repressor / biotin---[acetyl-CoA-carboxylase] ligase
MVTRVPDGDATSELSGTRFTDVRRLASTGSTNSDLLALARDGAPEGVVLVADHQTAGRGRLDRVWEAPAGASLLVSVLLRPDLPLQQAYRVTMATALAASEACEEVAGFRPLLKWPNDLVVDDRKLAGILAESVLTGGRLDAVVVGMGLNVNWPDDLPDRLGLDATAANLVAGHDVDRGDLLVSFLRRLEEWYGNERDLLAAYRERSATLGREVRVEVAGGWFEGRAVDVSGEGHLVVELPAGERREVAVGDVVHLRAV